VVKITVVVILPEMDSRRDLIIGTGWNTPTESLLLPSNSLRKVQGGPKSKPLPNDRKIVLDCIKACN